MDRANTTDLLQYAAAIRLSATSASCYNVCVNLSDCVKKGWIAADTATKMLADLRQRYAGSSSGYVIYPKNGFVRFMAAPAGRWLRVIVGVLIAASDLYATQARRRSSLSQLARSCSLQARSTFVCLRRCFAPRFREAKRVDNVYCPTRGASAAELVLGNVKKLQRCSGIFGIYSFAPVLSRCFVGKSCAACACWLQ